MYDQREKAQRDYDWALSGAREEGREEGREVGREEGALAGKIEVLQELLGEPMVSQELLLARSTDELSAQLVNLQRKLRDRQS